MKKFLTVMTLAVLFGTGIAMAETSSVSPEYTSSESDFRESTNAYGAINQKNNSARLLDAIRRRHLRYFRQVEEANDKDRKNIYTQKRRHQINLAESHVDGTQTDVKREGELQKRDRVQPVSRYRAQRANPKQTFRARAICYYVEGNDANADCMAANVIDGQTHRVQNTNSAYFAKKAQAEANAEVRRQLREAAKEVNEAAKMRVNNYRTGNYQRHFMAPFLKAIVE